MLPLPLEFGIKVKGQVAVGFAGVCMYGTNIVSVLCRKPVSQEEEEDKNIKDKGACEGE